MRFRPLCAVAVPLAALVCTASARAQTAPPNLSAPPPGAGGMVPGQVQVAPPPSLLLFNRALAETRAGHYARAEKLYRQLLTIEPNAATVWANLGLIEAYQGRIADAEKSFQIAVDKSPQTSAFRAQLAALQYRQGKTARADKNARLALKKEPKNPIALATLADLLMRDNRYADAVPFLRTLRAGQGSHPDDRTEINLILALNGAGKTSEALPIVRKRVARQPKAAQGYLILGDTLRLSGDLPGAKNAYVRAQTLDPQSAGAVVGLSVVAAQGGDQKAMLRLLDAQIAKHPNDARLYFQRGDTLYKMPDNSAPNDPARLKRLRDAEQAFYRAATLDPKNAVYLTYTGAAAMVQGETRYQAADNLFRAALNVEPRTTLARMGLAYIAEKQGKAVDALAQYRAILQYEPQNKDARRGVAGVLYATGKKDAAYREMRTIALGDPREIRVLAELGSWLAEDKRNAEATAVYDQILMRNPQDEGAYLALARLAEVEHQPDQARVRYRAALKAVPGSETAALLLGQSLLADAKKGADGKTDPKDPAALQAMDVYRALLAANPASAQARWQLAVLLHRAGQDAEALQQMQQIRLTDSDPNRTVYMLGAPRLLIETKRYPEAITTLRQLAQENPREDEVQYALADALAKSGQSKEAETIFIGLRDRRPTQGQTTSLRPLLLLGDTYELTARYDEAAAAYEETLRRDPTNLTALYGLERVRTRQGKPDAARQWLEELTLANPKEPLLSSIGSIRQLYMGSKNLAGYTAFTRRLAAAYPNDFPSQYLLARALTDDAAGTISPQARQEAIAVYGKLLVRDPKNADVQMQLGLQYEALGQKAEAIAVYQALLKQNRGQAEAKDALRRLGVSPDPIPVPTTTLKAGATPDASHASATKP